MNESAERLKCQLGYLDRADSPSSRVRGLHPTRADSSPFEAGSELLLEMNETGIGASIIMYHDT